MKHRIGDRYEFDRAADIIGRGGMGTVYKGIDTTNGQAVAIKQLKPDIIEDNPDFVERFNREAEALRRLNHPNIVAALDTIIDDNAYFLVMEYVGGGSLWDEMQNTKPMSIARVLQIALDLSDALTRAHRLKIIHRDLKPANILIAEDGTPRLTDFGVAQIQDKTRVTRTGTMVGTLAYLAPEALNGEPTDERADIWAFGIMLYEMLAGRSPFPEDNTTALITAILTRPIPKLNELRPDIPPALANLVEQMLIKEPEDRIDSIRKVGSELEDIIRRSDSKTDIPSDVRRKIVVEHSTRFDTPTPSAIDISKPVSSSSMTKPQMSMVKTDTGEEYLLVSKNMATRVWVIIGLLLIIAAGVITVIATRPSAEPTSDVVINTPPNDNQPQATSDNQPNQPPQALMTAPIGDLDYPILILPGISPETLNSPLQRTIYTDLVTVLEENIHRSPIRIFADAPPPANQRETSGPPTIEDLARLGNNARALLMVRPVQRQDGLYANIELVDTSRLTYNHFERAVISRLISIEVLVERPADLAPYLTSALLILYSADGNLFEFMRTLTILADLPPATGQILSTGISKPVYDYFLLFNTNEDNAMLSINNAINRDGGNPLLFTYRGLLHIRKLANESANSDLLTAKRLGPDEWAFPLYITTGLANSVGLSVTIDTIDTIVAMRPDDWFAHFARAHFAYLDNDLATTRIYLDMALEKSPPTNLPYFLISLVALREGNLTDSRAILYDMLRRYPNPMMSYRVLYITMGEAVTQSSMIYGTYANLLIGQYERVIETSDVLLNSAPPPGVALPYLYVSDVLMIRGLAQCSLGRYDDALQTFSQGLLVNRDNAMLHLLRADILLTNGKDASADIEAAMGLSDEMDAYVAQLTESTQDEPCGTFFDAVIAES